MRIKYSLAVILTLAFVLCACSAKPDQSPDKTTPPETQTESTATQAPAAPEGDGMALEGLITEDLFGNEINAQSFGDAKLIVLNIWATWCPPCVAELPELQKASAEFASKGVDIVGVLHDGIDIDGKKNAKVIKEALALLDDAQAEYTVILPDAFLEKQFISSMRYFPTTFFISAKGELIDTVIGANSFEDWSRKINEALELVE